MTTSVSYSDIAAVFGLSDMSYHYRKERERNGGCQTVAKKALLRDFCFVEEFEMVVLSQLGNTVIMTLFLPLDCFLENRVMKKRVIER